jgi:hypothetical protein
MRLTICGLLLIVTAAACRAQEGPELAFQAGVKKEVVDGDLSGAIEMFRLVVRFDPLRRAQAYLHIGRCYEKLGDAEDAVKSYEGVLEQSGEGYQKEAAEEAWKRLVALKGTVPKAGSSGWYNGDWQSGIPGLSNWYHSEQDYARVYDDFVVPPGGWTVTSVYSNNRMDFNGVTSASWEIRSNMGPGQAGRVVASGITRASQTMIPGSGPFPKDSMVGYRIQVDGLIVKLPGGHYWLSVAPVGNGKSYVSATRGRNAFGQPRGDNGQAFYSHPEAKALFVEAERIGRGGQGRIGKDFSQGLIIANSGN